MAMLLPIITQSQNEDTKLPEVGDLLNMSIAFDKVINSEYSTINLISLRGKLVILDFWATYCTNCIKEFPKLDSLQKKYGYQIQIVMIVQQAGNLITEENIKDFISNWHKKHSLDIPIAIVNSQDYVNTLFPHTTIPHYIWIDPDGRLMAKTMASFITKTNIETALEEYRNILQKRNNKIKKNPIKQN